MMALVDWLETGSEWAGTEGWSGEGWYVIDMNGIVAGRFDDEGEAMWWLDMSVRVA